MHYFLAVNLIPKYRIIVVSIVLISENPKKNHTCTYVVNRVTWRMLNCYNQTHTHTLSLYSTFSPVVGLQNQFGINGFRVSEISEAISVENGKLIVKCVALLN